MLCFKARSEEKYERMGSIKRQVQLKCNKMVGDCSKARNKRSSNNQDKGMEYLKIRSTEYVANETVALR